MSSDHGNPGATVWLAAGAAVALAHALPALAKPVPGVGAVLGIGAGTASGAGVALTFDDGPHPEGTPAVLETLRAWNAPATFFLVGEQVARAPALAAEVAAAGHGIALHCNRHRNMLRLTPWQVRDDLDRALDRIVSATGIQPALAAGLLLLLALSARILGEPPRRRDVIATIAIVVGIAVLAVAAPAPSHEHAHGAPLALALTALALLALAPDLLDRLGRGQATVTVAGAGVGYATGGVTTALAADALHRGAWLEALAWAVATGLASGSGLLSEMSALQERPAIHVAPVVFTIQTVVPVALAPWLLHATLTDPGQLPAVAAGLALVVAGSWALSRSTAVLGLTEA